MVTYAQLQAEAWWGREIQPAALVALGQRLYKAYGRPANSVGIKGDNRHLNGAHRSQEWIRNSRWCTNRTYTVQSGLTVTQSRYLSGLDFNPGTTARMIEICSRLDKAVRAGTLEQVREWYGNDDGDNRVDGYDNVRNRIASSDASHLWHLHLTLDRRLVNNPVAMQAVGDVLLGVHSINLGGDDVIGLRKGDRGEEVKGLQACLRYAGFDPGTVDGIYGDATAAKVLAMRKSQGSGTKSGNSFGGWAYAQLQQALADRRAEAAAKAALKQAKAAIEAALADQPTGLPAAIRIDLPDVLVVPVEPVGDDES